MPALMLEMSLASPRSRLQASERSERHRHQQAHRGPPAVFPAADGPEGIVRDTQALRSGANNARKRTD